MGILDTFRTPTFPTEVPTLGEPASWKDKVESKYNQTKPKEPVKRQVKSGTLKKVVNELKDKGTPLTPTHLSNTLKINFSAIKSAVETLEELDVVDIHSSKTTSLIQLKCLASLKN